MAFAGDGMSLDLTPLDEGLQKLLEATSGTKLAPALLREGKEVAADWRAVAPVLSGDYRDSLDAIVTSQRPGSARVSVRTDVFYARFNEMGTAHQIARPVGQRTFLRDEDPIVEGMTQAIQASLDETFR